VRARRLPIRRFVLLELGLWASLYPAYLAIRGTTIGSAGVAIDHATSLIDLERALHFGHEHVLQEMPNALLDFFSAYYMLGFGPMIAGTLIWLGLKQRGLYRELRTLLFVSLGLAVFLYVFYPTAPPRLVPGFGIEDTVGLSSHDTGSVAGIRFNPYAAMPSMHVGWSVLVGLIGFRAARNRFLKGFFLLHPIVMAVTVTATGNHYFIDSIAGAGAALAAVGIVAGVRRLRPSRGGEVVALPTAAVRVEERDRRAA
jgi:PAP2 superfamily